MPDQTTDNAAESAANVETTNPTNPNGDEGVQTTNSNETVDSPTVDAPDGAENGEADEEGADDTFKDNGEEPEVIQRKTAKDFIIERQKRKIAKMQKQNSDEADDEQDDYEDDPIETTDSDDPSDDDDKNSQLEAMRPIVEKHLADQDSQEVKKFLEDNPDFAPYSSKVERLMKHPSRRQIPVRALFYEAAGENLLKMGAERARKADAEAKGTRTGGNSNRDAMNPTDWSKASKSDLEAEKQRVREAARY